MFSGERLNSLHFQKRGRQAVQHIQEVFYIWIYRRNPMKNNELPLFPNKIYHIYNHANGKENLFENKGNYHFFLKRYAYFVEPIAKTFAYCLMPNHLHLLVEIKEEAMLQEANRAFIVAKKPGRKVELIPEELLPQFLSKIFGNLFSSYTQAFNRQQDRKGSLFMPNFKRKEVESEEYYTKLIHYIHANPVRHDFVKSMADWEYSSYQSLLSTKVTKLCRAEVMDWFGNRQAFIQFHQTEPFDERLGF